MSFFEPSYEPIFQNLPEQQRALVRKYGELVPQFQQAGVDPAIQQALARYDLARVSRGQNVLTRRQTAHAAMAAQTGEAVIKPKDRSLLNVIDNIKRDVFATVSAIPKLPVQLAREAMQLGDIPEQVAEQMAEGENVVTALSRAPGIRMIPGSYVAGELARGGKGLKELGTHPVFAGLDVLPIAGKVARGTAVGKAAVAEGKRPLAAVATRRLVEGELQPNVVGRGVKAVALTRPGQIVTEAVGKTARQVARVRAKQDWSIVEQAYGKRDTADPLAIATRQAAKLRSLYPEIDDARIAELTEMMQTNPHAIAGLADNERELIFRSKEIGERLAEQYRDEGLLHHIDGEWYSMEEGAAILKARDFAESSSATVYKRVPKLRQLAGEDVRINDVIRHIEAGDLIAASQEFSKVTLRRTHLQSPSRVGAKPGPPSDVAIATLINIRQEVRKAASAQKHLQKVEQAPPARFRPMLRTLAEEKLGDTLISRASGPEEIARITQAINERVYRNAPGFNDAEFQRIQDDVNATWRDLKAQGAEPVFVHHVPSDREWQLKYPRALESVLTPSAARSRTTDMAPYIKDMTVGLTHQGIELLTRRASEELVDTVYKTWGKTEDELLQQYLPAARVRAAQNPRLTVLGHVNDLFRKEYQAYGPDKFITWPSARVTGMDPNRVWLPNTVVNTLKRGHMPPGGKLTAPLDPIMGVFRTALLPLSPRWQIYNVFGGAVMVGARTGPGVVKHLNTALKMVRNDLGPDDLRILRRSSTRDTAEYNYYSGKTLGRLFGKIQESKAAQAVAGAGGKLIQKSFDLNSFFDDTYRAMTYLYGEEKGLRAGLTPEQAATRGMELARKTLQSWDELTPIERSVMRNVFPFYSFMQHILRYAFNYPFDHPVRASIVGSFGRNELNDLGTGLPESFLNAFWLGDMDESGHQLAINLRGLNPFADIPDYFTLAGFLGASNPVLSTLAESMGIDTRTGGPELFPTLDYDAETGRLTANTPGVVSTLVGNIVPQSQLLLALAQSSSEYKEIMRTNPAAARRMLLSQGGIPIMFRDYNVREEQFKAEVARLEAQDAAKNLALRSGVDTEARRFPGLRALIDQVRELQSQGALAAYEKAT